MSARDTTPATQSDDGWAELSSTEIAELDRRAAEADENQRNGVEGIPAREVLERLRRGG